MVQDRTLSISPVGHGTEGFHLCRPWPPSMTALTPSTSRLARLRAVFFELQLSPEVRCLLAATFQTGCPVICSQETEKCQVPRAYGACYAARHGQQQSGSSGVRSGLPVAASDRCRLLAEARGSQPSANRSGPTGTWLPLEMPAWQPRMGNFT